MEWTHVHEHTKQATSIFYNSMVVSIKYELKVYVI